MFNRVYMYDSENQVSLVNPVLMKRDQELTEIIVAALNAELLRSRESS